MATPSTFIARQWRAMAVATISVAMLGIASDAVAQRSAERVGDYTHTSWSQSEDVPNNVRAMAQTPDGWLWLASKSHLYRFDGLTSELYHVPDEDGSNLVSILATNAGDLWLGYADGATLVVHGDDFSQPRVVKGFVGQLVVLVQDGEGHVWGTSLNGLFEASQSTWQPVGASRGITGRHFFDMALDTQRTFWVLTDQGLFSLEPGQKSFRLRTDITRGLDWKTLVDGDDTAHVDSYARVYFFSVLALAGRHVVPLHDASTLLGAADTTGAYWFALWGGVYKGRCFTAHELKTYVKNVPGAIAANPGSFARLASGTSGMVFEDRQHNFWVGTKTGLDRFRPSVAKSIDLPDGLSNFTMLPDHDGGIWFGNAVSDQDFRWWHADTRTVAVPGYDMDTTSVYRDTDGSALIGTGDGYIRHFDGKVFRPMASLPSVAEKGDDIIAMVRDGAGRLWIAVRNHPIYENKDGQWLANGGFNELPPEGLLRAVVDARGRLWLSYPRELFVIDGDHVQRYGPESGMDVLNVRDIIPDGIPLIGGESGLAAFDGYRFHAISATDPAALTGITGLVRLGNGNVWINGLKGGVRIDADELKRGIADPSYKVFVRVYGPDEGMPGVAQVNRPLPTLVEGTDGRLWFASTDGMAWLDPAKIPIDMSAPNAVIRSMQVAGRSFRPEAEVNLPAGSRAFELDYTALGLGEPAKARFRYRLEGVDADWQDAGARRQAFYTNVGPGTYRFVVVASNEDGVWSKPCAGISISIAPYFYQTEWFLALCCFVALAVSWLAYIHHLRQLTHRLRQRLNERYAERDRIARELHDTFLQTVQSLVLKIHAVSRKLPEGELRESIACAASLADEAISEGRDKVQALRALSANPVDLAPAFEKVIVEHCCNNSPSVQIMVTGKRRCPDPLVIDELYACGREAIVNAIHHSGATSIQVTIDQERSGIRIEISDDGKGIDPKVLAEGGRPGHWGLRGIRERIDRIGGKFRLISDAASGTTVVLFVGANRAYRRRFRHADRELS